MRNGGFWYAVYRNEVLLYNLPQLGGLSIATELEFETSLSEMNIKAKEI